MKKNCLGEETQAYLKYESKLWIVVKNLKAFKVDNTTNQQSSGPGEEERALLFNHLFKPMLKVLSEEEYFHPFKP